MGVIMAHKWAKEIKAWADGAEIEQRCHSPSIKEIIWSDWEQFDGEWTEEKHWEYRIKPQPKENYLYVYRTSTNGQIEYRIYHDKDACGALLGKIKLEDE
jgi:hypothetical protein